MLGILFIKYFKSRVVILNAQSVLNWPQIVQVAIPLYLDQLQAMPAHASPDIMMMELLHARYFIK